MVRVIRFRTFFVFSLSLMSLSACKILPEVSNEPLIKATPAASELSLIRYSGHAQSGAAAANFTYALGAMVRDSAGDPVKGIKVNWAVTSGGVTLSSSSNTTLSDGYSYVTATAGNTVGSAAVTATIDGSSTSVTYDLTIIPANSSVISIVSGNTQTGVVGNALALPFTVRVTDAYGNVISGQQVNWLVTAQGGSISASSSNTNSSGLTNSTLTLGTTSGAASVTATINGTLTSQTFTATANPDVPNSITITGGDAQTGVVANALATAFTVRVADVHGNAISGQQVNWAVTAQGGSMSAASSNTNGSGIATSTLTLGSAPGAAAVSATVNGTAITTSFSATAIVDAPNAIAVVSGNAQTGVVANALALPFTVRVTDVQGNTISGVQVDWAVTAQGGSLSVASSNTNASGLATSTLTLGTASGTAGVSATVNGTAITTSFSATANPDVPTAIAIVSGDAQTGIVANALALPFSVRVTDTHGNNTPSIQVDWAVTAQGGNLSASNSNTNASGLATSTLTLGTVSGAAGVSATVNGTAITTAFSATATEDAPNAIAIVSGDAQTAVVANALALPFSVRVTDIQGNNIPSAQVDWAVTAQGGSLSVASSNTNASGIATSTLTLGTASGVASVSATVNGTAITTAFSATADPDVPNSISVVSGNNQTAAKATLLPTAFTVSVLDQHANACPSIQVDWVATVGGGSLSVANSSTNASGEASSTLTLGANPGTNTVTATVNGTAIATSFTATGSGASFTQDWAFDTAGAGANYTYDSSLVDFVGGSALLKTADQVDDDNTATGFSGATSVGTAWNAGSSSMKLGSAGACDGTSSNCASFSGASYSGSITSRIIDLGEGGTAGAWASLAWKAPLPFGKELPASASSESSTDYSGITANLMTGNVGLWRMNESAAGTVNAGTQDFEDFSGQGNHGTASSGITYGGSGILNQSASFDGSAQVAFGSTSIPTGASNRTISLWFKQNGSGDQTLFSYGTVSAEALFELSLISDHFIFENNSDDTTTISALTTPGSWHHAAVTWNGSVIKIYLNGVYLGQKAFTINTGTTFYTLASGGLNSNFNGSLDEIAVWSRALSDSEISQVYKRGASRIHFQIRSCANSNCSDGTFVGPDGTASTYFTEINNSALTSPVMTFSSFGSLTVAANRYFQYKAILETQGLATQAPNLESVTIGADHYTAAIPTVVNITPVSVYTLSAFTETLGASSCSGLRYVVSVDGAQWYYWTGAAWGVSNLTYSRTSSASTINTNIGSLIATSGTGSFYWKAYLNSSSTAQCEISNIQIQGTN